MNKSRRGKGASSNGEKLDDDDDDVSSCAL